jgi:hypothetical protein
VSGQPVKIATRKLSETERGAAEQAATDAVAALRAAEAGKRCERCGGEVLRRPSRTIDQDIPNRDVALEPTPVLDAGLTARAHIAGPEGAVVPLQNADGNLAVWVEHSCPEAVADDG